MTFPGFQMDWLTLAQADSGGKSILQHIASGGPIGLIIILLSFAAVALVVMHSIQIRLDKLAPAEQFDKLRDLLTKRELDNARTYCDSESHDSFLTRVIGAALTRCARSPFGLLEFRGALEESGRDQVARLYRSTEGLSLIVTVAPMLGLLGTVLGMVGAFNTLGSSSGGFAKPDELASSISAALVFFRNRIDSVTSEVAVMTEELLGLVESHQSNAQRGQPAQPARKPAVAPVGTPRA